MLQTQINEPSVWERAMSDNVVRCKTSVPDGFRGTVMCNRLANVDCDWIVASQHKADHTSADICMSEAGIVLVGVVASGSVWVSQDGREAELGPGEFAIRDSTRPYSLAFDAPFSQLVCRVLRSLLRQRFGPFDHFTATKVPGSCSLGRLASEFILSVGRIRLADAFGAEAQRLALQVVDLVGMALSARAETCGGRSVSTHRAALLYRAKAFVEAHLSEPLTPEVVATAMRCSARYINKLFADEGTTLGHYVMERRLMQCRLDLERPNNHRQVSEIAYAWGFSSLSHFSRSFKQHFDSSPSEYRMRHVGLQ